MIITEKYDKIDSKPRHFTQLQFPIFVRVEYLQLKYNILSYVIACIPVHIQAENS